MNNSKIAYLFTCASTELQLAFKKTLSYQHNGIKGNERESKIKEFLESKLPHKYKITSGEIINQDNLVSHQIDIIVYNHFDSAPIEVGSNTSILPIESVYGTIEVKSKLSKEKLIEGLENIKSVKQLWRFSAVITKINPMMEAPVIREQPFGIIFAYEVSGNSLESLAKNVFEWQREAKDNNENTPEVVAILDKGLIIPISFTFTPHKPSGYGSFTNMRTTIILTPNIIEYKENTLFYLYCHLIDECNKRYLVPPSLLSYYHSNIKK